MHLNELANVLKTIGEENRLKILCTVFRESGICVSKIALLNNLSVATTSHHLKKLESIGVIAGTRSGKENCFTIRQEAIVRDIKKLICTHLKI